MRLVVAEKPSVARDIASVLGARSKGDGCLSGGDWVVTWCIGHLIELDEPAAYDAKWKRWSFASLPMLPTQFKLRPTKNGKQQWRVVRDLMRQGRFAGVVNACDAGREGELIFRLVYERAASRLPIERLWISSLTPEAIRSGFARLAPGARYDNLADAAKCRSEADWLVGMNATRAMTLGHRSGSERGVYSIGRVQTPTLALLVRREQEIRAFVPQDFWELKAKLPSTGDRELAATWRDSEGSSRLNTDALATALKQRVDGIAKGELVVERLDKKKQTERAPQLFDLTTLQRVANRRYGLSAERTLNAAQTLYERHKVLTYPRTDSNVLSEDQRAGLPGLIRDVGRHPDYARFSQQLLSSPLRITKRIIDDSKVSDHHAIVPTGKHVDLDRLGHDERNVFDIVARRFLAAFMPDAVFEVTKLVLRAGSLDDRRPSMKTSTEAREKILDALPPPPDRFYATARVTVDAGWQAVEPPMSKTEAPEIPTVQRGDRLPATLDTPKGQTRPPRRFDDASLLASMESAGKTIDDEALRAAMKDCGLGTPATRAATIETLIRREYVRRSKKQLVPTDRGIEVIDKLPVPTLASAEMTGEWERRLSAIAAGRDSRAAFMTDVAQFVRESVETMAGGGSATPFEPTVLGPCPECQGDVMVKRSVFSCAACSLSISRQVARREISPVEARTLFARGRVGPLYGLRSKKGRKFSATLVLKDGAVELEFAPRPGQDGGGRSAGQTGRQSAAQKPRARANASKVDKPPPADPALATLVCPRCGQTGLIVGKAAWGCAHWRDGCRYHVPFVMFDKKMTISQVKDLTLRGKTRPCKFGCGKGRVVDDGERLNFEGVQK